MLGPISASFINPFTGTGGAGKIGGTINYGEIGSESLLNAGMGGYATSAFVGDWVDSLTVSSSSLPAGTPVITHSVGEVLVRGRSLVNGRWRTFSRGTCIFSPEQFGCKIHDQ